MNDDKDFTKFGWIFPESESPPRSLIFEGFETRFIRDDTGVTTSFAFRLPGSEAELFIVRRIDDHLTITAVQPNPPA